MVPALDAAWIERTVSTVAFESCPQLCKQRDTYSCPGALSTAPVFCVPDVARILAIRDVVAPANGAAVNGERQGQPCVVFYRAVQRWKSLALNTNPRSGQILAAQGEQRCRSAGPAVGCFAKIASFCDPLAEHRVGHRR